MFRKILLLLATLCYCGSAAAIVSAVSPETVTLDTAGTGMRYDAEKSAGSLNERFSGQASLRGVMQAYWLPVWNEETEENDKYLRFRFAPDVDNLSSLPKLHEGGKLIQPVYINLQPPVETAKGKEAIAFFTNDAMFEQVKKDFEIIPDNFFRYREGHIEQPGTLLIDHYLSENICDRRSFFAQLLAFAPQKNTFSAATLAERFAAEAGCGRALPYEEGFSVDAPEDIEVALKAAPDEKSETLRLLLAGEAVIKIETVNDLWLKVSLYDQPDVKGYLLRSQLIPDS